MITFKTRRLRRWFAWAMLSVLILSLILWYVTRDTLPREIRIAAGHRNGLYYRFAQAFAARLEKRTRRPVVVRETQGAAENQELLLTGKVDLALLQTGPEAREGIRALAPIFPEIVHVLVRKGRGIHSLQDLRGKNMVVGSIGSGTREDALRILGHYQIHLRDFEKLPADFGDLASHPEIDAAVATTGYLNPGLSRLLASGNFTLLPISDADALAIRYPFYTPTTIPHGLYGEAPPVPDQPVPAVGVTAFLAARQNASDALVTGTLSVLYEDNLRTDIPALLPLDQARTWSAVPFHPAARSYFEPYAGVLLLATFLQSLSAAKELFFAFGAGLYLIWDRWTRLREKEQRTLMSEQKERLDLFLKETMVVERAQMNSEDPKELKQYLDEVTRIKLRALEELTHEKLRDHQVFVIFLMQCSYLINKIQDKIMIHSLNGTVPRKS